MKDSGSARIERHGHWRRGAPIWGRRNPAVSARPAPSVGGSEIRTARDTPAALPVISDAAMICVSTASDRHFFPEVTALRAASARCDGIACGSSVGTPTDDACCTRRCGRRAQEAFALSLPRNTIRATNGHHEQAAAIRAQRLPRARRTKVRASSRAPFAPDPCRAVRRGARHVPLEARNQPLDVFAPAQITQLDRVASRRDP